MISRALHIIIVLILTASCSSNKSQVNKINKLENSLDKSVSALLALPQKYLQTNDQLCKTLPAKYKKAEDKLKRIKDETSYKFQAGIISGIYRFTTLRTNCNSEFLNKNHSIFTTGSNIKGKQKFNMLKDFYFIQGEILGFTIEAMKLDMPEADYSDIATIVIATQLSLASKMGVQSEKSMKLLSLASALKEKESFTDYGLPLK